MKSTLLGKTGFSDDEVAKPEFSDDEVAVFEFSDDELSKPEFSGKYSNQACTHCSIHFNFEK